eukprot:14942225-Alexandrium_andersonii.AAC.1
MDSSRLDYDQLEHPAPRRVHWDTKTKGALMKAQKSSRAQVASTNKQNDILAARGGALAELAGDSVRNAAS